MAQVKNFSIFIFVLAIEFTSAAVMAQFDPSDAILRKSGCQAEESGDFSSDRYTVRPGLARPTPSAPALGTPVIPAAKATSPVNGNGPVPDSAAASEASPLLPVVPLDSALKTPTDLKREVVPDLKDAAKDQTMAEDDFNGNLNQGLDPRDVRHNMLEFSAALTYLYADSSSSYWFRDHFTSAAGLKLHAQFWATPFFALQSTHMTSLEGSLRDNPAGTRSVSVDQRYYDLGLRFRRIFGVSRKSPGLTFGLDYRESRFEVPADDTDRVRLRTSGVRLSAELFAPSGPRVFWQIGAEFVPRAQHQEIKTGLAPVSGAENKTDVVGLWLTQTFILDRKNQMYWRLGHSVEKNVFEGSAQKPDPITQTIPVGVTVTHGLTALELGYCWGE